MNKPSNRISAEENLGILARRIAHAGGTQMEAVNLETTNPHETPQNATVADNGGPDAQCSHSEFVAVQACTIQQNNAIPMLVRVKRKCQQAPIDALWLEIHDRPLKRQTTDLTRLSLSDSTIQAESRKLLFHHVETVSTSGDDKSLIQSILQKSGEDHNLEQRQQERREGLKKLKDKHDHLRASARQKHENVAKNARFQQVWRSRRRISEMSSDSGIHELYHLYDVVRVDVEEEISKETLRREKARSEPASKEYELLSNFLPLIRECLPSAAAEFENDLNSAQRNEQDDYVYDVYTLGKYENVAEKAAADYPLVEVEDEFYYGDPVESDVDSDDSNDENNPLNDYPEEESDIEYPESRSSSYDSEELNPFSKDDDAFTESDDEDRRWACRR